MKPVRFLAEARAEVLEAAVWYEERRKNLGVEFRQAIDAAVRCIGENPARWPPHFADTRRLRLKQFPYLVIFRERPDRIAIMAVAHARRNPGYWAGRQ